MKYKVGDRVRIKSLEWYNRYTNGTEVKCKHFLFICDMKKYCGQIMTINVVGGFSYDMIEDDGTYVWTDEMIEGLVEEEVDLIPKFGEFSDNEPKDMGEVSDGYHTFNELYEYRMLYNAALFNEFAKQGLYDVHKSRKHSDGEYPFGDPNWFIVMAELPTGQISNHYKMKDWDKFQIPEKLLANKWDEHSPRDVANRLISFTTPKKEYPKSYEECVKCIKSVKEASDRAALLCKLERLLVCRDAYWKIAGEEMGLGKPWRPSKDKIVYNIYRQSNEIETDIFSGESVPFEFPTKEMRDDFKKNFDPDIEICKEFL